MYKCSTTFGVVTKDTTSPRIGKSGPMTHPEDYECPSGAIRITRGKRENSNGLLNASTVPTLTYIGCSTLISKSIMLIKCLLVFLILCKEILSSPMSNFFFYLESRLLYSDCQDILPYQLWSSPSAPCEI